MSASSPNPTPNLLAHCPLCQAAYDDGAVQLLGESGPTLAARGTSRMFHLTCKKCARAVLAVILESAQGVSSIGLVTDLEAQDAVRVHTTAPISADDVVAAHQAITLQSRTLCKALSQTT